MSESSSELPGDQGLYALLPAVYRVRDAEQDSPLRALLSAVEAELRTLEADVEGLYDDWFVETCAEWVVPYIGDLLGARGLLAAGEGPFSQRSRVANTLGYRRGKGTAAVLEQLARDVTGWPARAVELFERLATTQHVNHPRPFALATASLRNADALELLRGPFGSAPHVADVRHVDNRRGRHNIPHVGIFLWRLQSYAVTRSSARPAPGAAPALAGRYTFHPLGLEAPLYNLSRTETEISFLAGESNVPGPLRRRPVAGALEALRLAGADDPAGASYFGTDPVLEVFVQREPGGPMRAVPPAELLVCDLSDAPDAGIESDWRRPQPVRDYPPEQGGPRPITAAVDPVTGRLAFPAGVSPQRVEVSYAYGFAGDLGGGPYDRRAAVQALVPDPGEVGFQVGVTRDAPAGHPHLVPDLGTAVRAWNARPAGDGGGDRPAGQPQLQRIAERERTPSPSPPGAGWPSSPPTGRRRSPLTRRRGCRCAPPAGWWRSGAAPTCEARSPSAAPPPPAAPTPACWPSTACSWRGA